MSRDESSAFPTTLVDVGGYRLAITCMGTGSPTVVLDAGMGDASEVWHQVQEAVSQFTQVCSYDRAGLGQSDPGPKPRTSQTIIMANDEHLQILKQNGYAKATTRQRQTPTSCFNDTCITSSSLCKQHLVPPVSL